MTSLPFYSNSHNTIVCLDWSLFDSDISFIKIGYIMHAIDFVNTIETFLLNHRLCPSWALFSRLEQQSNTLIRRDLWWLFYENLSCSKKHGSMSIMPAHMSMVRLRSVRQAWVIFRHEKCIYICSESYSFTNSSILAAWFSFAFYIYYKTSRSTFSDRFTVNPNSYKCVNNSLLSFKFFETTFSILVDILAQFNHLF